MEEVLKNLIIIGNMRVKKFIYTVAMVVFSYVLTIFSKNTLAWSISSSQNHIKEGLMLWLGVDFQKFVIYTK